MRRTILFSLLLALLLLPAILFWPDRAGADFDDATDMEKARAAMRAGHILPLSRILEAVERDFNGEVIEVELEYEHERWIYELRLLSPRGAVLKLEYDARNAKLFRARGRDLDAARKAH